MARFPVPFGRRKSAVAKEDGEAVPSFRVLERAEVGAKSFDGPRMTRPTSTLRPYSQTDILAEEENMFASLTINRYVVSSFQALLGRSSSRHLQTGFGRFPMPINRQTYRFCLIPALAIASCSRSRTARQGCTACGATHHLAII
jgi:hypothetical protein